MKRLLPFLSILIFLAAFVILLGRQIQLSSGVFAFDAQLSIGHYVREIVRTVLLAAVMLGGIVFGFLYKQSSRPGVTEFHVGTELSAMWRSAVFWQSLLVSPLIFCTVFIFSRSAPDSAAALIFAFENGFFCKVVAERTEQGRIERLQAASASSLSAGAGAPPPTGG